MTQNLKPLPRHDKFRDAYVTAAGARRASVAFKGLETLWVNTGTLCNLTCANCYIESSPTNDSLSYITLGEVTAYLDEITAKGLETREIGFTGGEPFMNPDIMAMLEEVLGRGLKALVLTNAMKPLSHHREGLAALARRFGAALSLRVSLDHYTAQNHEIERGPEAFAPTLEGVSWLCENGLDFSVAGRTCWGEDEPSMRRGYARLFDTAGIDLDAENPAHLVLFPEMDLGEEVPEITEDCWSLLGVSPHNMMCATSRMVVKRKGSQSPVVVACTLLPSDKEFELGKTLEEAERSVPLNHPHCARFCVLGGGSCGGG